MHVKLLIFILTAISAKSHASSFDLFDIYGNEVAREAKMYNGYWVCDIQSGAVFDHSGTWIQLSDERRIQNTIHGDVGIAGSRRFLPQSLDRKLPISSLQVLDLLKSLHAAGSICCASACHVKPGINIHIRGTPRWYRAKVECQHRVDMIKMDANFVFVGDNPGCQCSTNVHDSYTRKNAYCEIPCVEDTDDWFCDQINFALDNCNQKPKWVESDPKLKEPSSSDPEF